MGSKSAAKALMETAGVPLVPGYHGEAQDYETFRAAAEILDVHQDKLMQFIESGVLPSFQLGRHKLIRKTALEAFQRQREQQQNYFAFHCRRLVAAAHS